VYKGAAFSRRGQAPADSEGQADAWLVLLSIKIAVLPEPSTFAADSDDSAAQVLLSTVPAAPFAI